MLALGELEKKIQFLILCHLLQKDRVVFQTNLLVIWSSATFFDIFFLSKFLQAKVVMVVLRIGLINRSNVLLHSHTNIYKIFFHIFRRLCAGFDVDEKIFKLFWKRIFRRFKDFLKFTQMILFCFYSGCTQFSRFIIGNVRVSVI